MATGLSFQEGLTRGTTIGFLGVDITFVSPVMAGDTIYQVSKCIDKRETKKPGRGIVFIQRDVFNQRDECVLKQVCRVMVMK